MDGRRLWEGCGVEAWGARQLFFFFSSPLSLLLSCRLFALVTEGRYSIWHGHIMRRFLPSASPPTLLPQSAAGFVVDADDGVVNTDVVRRYSLRKPGLADDVNVPPTFLATIRERLFHNITTIIEQPPYRFLPAFACN